MIPRFGLLGALEQGIHIDVDSRAILPVPAGDALFSHLLGSLDSGPVDRLLLHGFRIHFMDRGQILC